MRRLDARNDVSLNNTKNHNDSRLSLIRIYRISGLRRQAPSASYVVLCVSLIRVLSPSTSSGRIGMRGESIMLPESTKYNSLSRCLLFLGFPRERFQGRTTSKMLCVSECVRLCVIHTFSRCWLHHHHHRPTSLPRRRFGTRLEQTYSEKSVQRPIRRVWSWARSHCHCPPPPAIPRHNIWCALWWSHSVFDPNLALCRYWRIVLLQSAVCAVRWAKLCVFWCAYGLPDQTNYYFKIFLRCLVIS